MKKRKIVCLLVSLIAILLAATACRAGENTARTEPGEEEAAALTLTDRSVYELYFNAPEPEIVWKEIRQRGDGVPVSKQLYRRCEGFTFQITGIYEAGGLDDAIASQIGYVEDLTEEAHGGVTYKTAFFPESDMYFAAAEHNGSAYLIEYWGDDGAAFGAFLDGLYFAGANEEPPDMSLVALSYTAPAAYEELNWRAEESVGEGLYLKSIVWETRDAEGNDAQFSVSYNKNTDVDLKLDSRLEYTEKEINGYAFRAAYADYAKAHYYAAQVGEDCYLVDLYRQEDENYPPFRSFLNGIRIETP